MVNDALGRLRIVGFFEGVSFLLLLGVAMPMKYIGDNPQPTTVIGMVHGILFVFYVVMVYLEKKNQSWSWKTTLIALIAGIIPFGTFYADARIFSKKSKA